MGSMDEHILVIRRSDLFDGEFADEFAFQGLETDFDIVNRLLYKIYRYISVSRRGDVEEDPTYKQIIPYVVLERLGGEDDGKIFMYERLSGSGEKRLVGNISIGVGGHMNDEGFLDRGGSWNTIFHDNVMRELHEELIFNPENTFISLSTVGFINDDSDDVGKVHLGILIKALIGDKTEVTVRETDKLKGQWVSFEDLKTKYYDRLENWAKIALGGL